MKAENKKTFLQQLRHLTKLRDNGKISTLNLHEFLQDNSKFLEIINKEVNQK